MEPIKGHESSDDRSDRPFIKAPIPLSIETDPKSKSKKKKPEISSQREHKSEKAERPSVVEEGLLFQREPEVDKLKPSAPEPVFEAQPEQQAQQADEKPEVAPEQPSVEAQSEHVDQAAFEAEVEQQIVAEQAKVEAQPVDPDVNNDYLAALEKAYSSDNEQTSPAPAPEAAPQTHASSYAEQTPLDAARAAAANAYSERIAEDEANQPVTDPHLVGAVPLGAPGTRPNQAAYYPDTSHERTATIKDRRKSTSGKQKITAQIGKLKHLIKKQKAKPAHEQARQLTPEQVATPVARRTGPEVMTMPIPAQTAERPASTVEQPPVVPVEQVSRPAHVAEQRVTPAVEQLPPTNSEQLLPSQLVQVAERIYIDGITVRSMYEVGRFDQDSLQRIVDTYLKGGNTAKVVYEEVQRHDRERFDRFETLNQVPRAGATALYGPITSPVQSAQHGSLPPPLAQPQHGASVNPNTQQPTQTPARKPAVSTAEKAVLGVSIFFVIIAAVILIGLFTRG